MIYYRNLQQCLDLGMKWKKIHRILKLKQKDWMKSYIDFNAQKRKEATNEADKNHLKLLNNVVYGKTMENMREKKIRVVKNSQLHKKNPYKKMRKYKELFDVSNFPVSSKYYCSSNKKVVGKMKDE